MVTQCVGQKNRILIIYLHTLDNHLHHKIFSSGSSPNFQLLQLNGLARTPATEYACMNEKNIKPLILVLGLLQVVGIVKIKILILVLCLLQVVDTVKIKALILVLAPYN